jgi:putative transposase
MAGGLSMSKTRKRHTAEQVVKKLRDADAMLAAGKSIGEVLQSLEVSEATLSRWRSQYGGMKSEEAKRLKQLEDENGRLKKLVADQALDIQMLKEIAKGN